jgi:hypothetical protein
MIHFNGPEETHSPEANARLKAQHTSIVDLMKDGYWRTLRQISMAVGAPEPSVSAQLRHCRKARFGGHTVNRRYVRDGLYEYQLILKGPTMATVTITITDDVAGVKLSAEAEGYDPDACSPAADLASELIYAAEKIMSEHNYMQESKDA